MDRAMIGGDASHQSKPTWASFDPNCLMTHENNRSSMTYQEGNKTSYQQYGHLSFIVFIKDVLLRFPSLSSSYYSRQESASVTHINRIKRNLLIDTTPIRLDKLRRVLPCEQSKKNEIAQGTGTLSRRHLSWLILKP